jgi:aldehyde dehydrogenase (NAD+)
MNASLSFPDVIPNQIGGRDYAARDGRTFQKFDPATGQVLCSVVRSSSAEVDCAVRAAKAAQPAWAALTVVKRGDILRNIALLMREHRDAMAALVAKETGKSKKDALGETDAAIEMGFFVAGEGRRFYGQTSTSAVPNKSAMVMRQPLGVAGLIIAANTPIANVAWKAFPALLCGNAAILKAAEDTPACPMTSTRRSTVSARKPGRRSSSIPTSPSSASPARARWGAGLRKPRDVALRKCVSSSAERIRSSSATTRISRMR